MPGRTVIAKELANLLGALSHPHRIRIIEELRSRELDVNSLQKLLAISHSSVSQNLAVLRAHRLVQERREGRRVIYNLTQPKLAAWLVDGLHFLEGDLRHTQEMRDALDVARTVWGAGSDSAAKARPQLTNGTTINKPNGTNGAGHDSSSSNSSSLT